MIKQNKLLSNEQDELKNHKTITRIIAIILFVAIFGQRILIPFGSTKFPVILLVIYISLFILGFTKKIGIQPLRFWLYTISVTFALLISLFQQSYSVTSLFYFVAIYFPLIFTLNIFNVQINNYLFTTFQKYMFFCAILGTVQFVIQYAGVAYIDFLSLIFPDNFLQSGYNTSYPIEYGSAIYKSNGIFFLEPSFFSQFLAISFIIEFFYFRRILKSSVYLIALIFTFSGTGLLLVAIAIIPLILKQSKAKIVLILSSGALFLIWFLNTTYGSLMLLRLNEFNDTGSSANVRFVSPFKAMLDVFNSDGQSTFFGIGAGMADQLNISYRSDFTAIPKLFLEYGIFVGSLFSVFLLICFFRKNQLKLLSFTLFLMYLFLSGSLLQPQTVFIFYTLLMLPQPSNSIVRESLSKKRRKLKIALN